MGVAIERVLIRFAGDGNGEEEGKGWKCEVTGNAGFEGKIAG